MTVVAHDQRDQYIAAAGQTVFNYTFEISAATDLKVYKRASGSLPDDVADLLTYPTQYTVTDVGNDNGGTIVLVTPATLNDVLTIEGNVPIARSTTFTPGGLIRAEDLNTEFDNITLIQQRTQTIVDSLTPKYAYSAYVQQKDLVLPVLGAGQVWAMNATMTAIDGISIVFIIDLASHAAGKGASMVGLQDQSNVTSKTVQDFANAPILAKSNTGVLQNGYYLGSIASGVLKNTTISGDLSISAPLTSIDNLTTTSDQTIYTTGSNTYATTALTAFGRSLISDLNAAGALSTLGVTPFMQSILASASKTIAFDALSPTSSKGDLIVNNGTNNVRLPVGTNGLYIMADSTSSTGLTYAPASGSLPLTTKGDLVTYDGTSNVRLGVGADGQSLIADSTSLTGLNYANMLPTSGGTMTGAIAMGSSKITGLGNPTNPQDAATKSYVDTALPAGGPFLPLSGGTMTGAINMGSNLISNVTNPVGNQDAATKFYVDQTALTGTAVYAATTASLNATHAGAGVGATLTDASGTFGIFTIDGVSPPLNSNILNKNQSNAAYQGIYKLTQNGDGVSVPWVLTRSTTYDTPDEINQTGLIIIQNGTSQAGQAWYNAATIITVDTTNFSFSTFGTAGTVSSVTFTGDGTVLSSTPSTPVTSSGTLTATLNTQTANTVLAGPTTGIAVNPSFRSLLNADLPTVSPTKGGTGLTSITSNNLIVGNGTGTANLIAPSATSGVPLVSQGAAVNPAFGTTVVAGGGTGVTSLTAYAPIFGGTTGTGAVQSGTVGTSGQVLTSNGPGALPTFKPLITTGTFAPTIIPSSGAFASVTYGYQYGEYTQIGNLVFYQVALLVNSYSVGTASGGLAIGTLPIASGGNTINESAILMQNVTFTGSPVAQANGTAINIIGSVSGGGTNIVQVSNVGSSALFRISGTYFSS